MGSSAFPRTIKHDLGATTIPQKPVRIAALTGPLVDGSVALGLQVVALTDLGLGKGKVPDYLGSDGEKLAGDAVVVGPLLEPSLEKIAATKPDLIISQSFRHEKIYDQLSKIAPTVMSDQTGVGWREILRLLASATGTEANAEKLISTYESRASEIGTKLKNKIGHAPTAAPIRFSGGATVRLYVANSFAGSVLRDAGFVLSDHKATDAAGSRVDVSQENLLMLDAEYMFIASSGDDAAARQAETFKANPLWKRLNGEIVNVRDETWITGLSYSAANSMLDDIEKQFGLTG
ncbi:iron-siderophore ABC transporter substrate-binding protein [Micromonospora sp. B11E3]|uniref:ABC transporter substrate-binding protein n=1 Tax=Micromonospora sp. B11E3 TaxID=3153562 RepID=UPI00325D6541